MEMTPRGWKAFFDGLLDSVNDAVTIVDREGTVLCWNTVAERIYGIPRDQIVGKRIGEFFQRGSLMLYQVMETGRPVYQVYHTPRPDKHVFINTVPIYDDTGELIGAISIEQDITHTVKLSEELYSIPDSAAPTNGRKIVSRNGSMRRMIEFLVKSSKRSSSILLAGESGVGKETLAKTAHQAGKSSGPFLAISCDTLPDGLLDTELFGYQGGAFGEKREERPGKFDLAGGGTVYLKNVDRLPLSTQSKLAQALGERQFYRVGGTSPIPLRCRVIASASPEIENLVAGGNFLQDLYYSFHVLKVPPLRERKEDLPELCHLFLSETAQTVGKPAPRLSSEVMAALTTYHWPGNLPQLRNVMEHLVIVADGNEIHPCDLPPAIRLTTLSDLAEDSLPLPTLSEEMERSKIEDALKRTGGNKAGAARLLGISRGSLYYKMKQYGL